MTTYMHCRPCTGNHIPTCSCSLFFLHPNCIITSNYSTFTSPTYNHDQTSSPPPPIPSRRRRLEDPIITHASNYYATLPHQMSHSITKSSPSPPPPPPPLPPPRRTYQQSNRKDDYCDLFNLLDRPPTPIKQRRKCNNIHTNSHRHHQHHHHHHRSIDIKQVKDSNDRKSNHHHRQLISCQTTEHSNDKLLSKDKTKHTNEICQRRTTNKGFFRRVMHNYFCMPSPITNSGYSS